MFGVKCKIRDVIKTKIEGFRKLFNSHVKRFSVGKG